MEKASKNLSLHVDVSIDELLQRIHYEKKVPDEAYVRCDEPQERPRHQWKQVKPREFKFD